MLADTPQSPPSLETSETWQVLEPLGNDPLFERWLVCARQGDARARYILSRLTPDLQQAPNAMDALNEETALASQVYHPNLPRMYGLEDAPGGPYLLHDAPEGVTLRTLMAFQAAPLAPSVAAEITRQLCEAASALAIPPQTSQTGPHSYAHLNLCSDNICIDLYGDVKLLSIGTAAWLLGNQVERQQRLALTPVAAPEVTDFHQPLGQATTQYHIGVVAFELLTGVSLQFELEALARQLAQSPEGSGQPPHILLGMAQRALPGRLHEVTHLPSGGLNQVLSRMLAWQPSERFASLQEAAAALVQAAFGMSQGTIDYVTVISEAVRLIRTDLPAPGASSSPWMASPEMQGFGDGMLPPPDYAGASGSHLRPDASGTQELPAELSTALQDSAPLASNLLQINEEIALEPLSPLNPHESTFVADPLAPPPRAQTETTSSRLSQTGEMSTTGSFKVSGGKARAAGGGETTSPIFGGAAAEPMSAPPPGAAPPSPGADPYGPTSPRAGYFPPPPRPGSSPGIPVYPPSTPGNDAYGNSQPGYDQGPTIGPETPKNPAEQLLAQFMALPKQARMGIAGGLVLLGLLGMVMLTPSKPARPEIDLRADVQLGDANAQNPAVNGRVEEPLPQDGGGASELARAMEGNGSGNGGGDAGGDSHGTGNGDSNSTANGVGGDSRGSGNGEENGLPRNLNQAPGKLAPEQLKPFKGKRKFGFGSISVDTSPPSSVVILDGRDKQNTPVIFEDLPAGEHQLIFRNEEFGTRDVVVIDLDNGEGFSGTWSYQSKKFMALD